MKSLKKQWFNVFIAVVCVLGFLSLSSVKASAADMGGWKWKADASVGLSYNTNVYKLSLPQINRLEANGPDDQTSGRYNDMDSVNDFIFTPRLSASFRRSGIMGKHFSVKPSIAYNVYRDNTEKNYFDFGLDLIQSLGKQGTLGLELGYAPNIYKKNFLSDAVDTKTPPGTKNKISSNEEIFSPAHYDDTSVIVSYGRSLWKSNKKHTQYLSPEAVSAKVLAGYNNRSYDDPFSIRSEDTLLAGFNLKLSLHKNTSLALKYLFKNIDTTVGTEVLIRDEAPFGVDLNGNGNMTDINIRTEQKVDRSRNSHTLGAKVSTRLVKGWSGYAKYEARFTSYKSDETFDVTRLNRDDTRQKAGLGLKGQLAQRWTLALDWVTTHNAASRDGLVLIDQAETKSYNRNVFSAIITYRL